MTRQEVNREEKNDLDGVCDIVSIEMNGKAHTYKLLVDFFRFNRRFHILEFRIKTLQYNIAAIW